MKTAELRAAYLRFFQERGHTIVPGSSLVPPNDPTLLFTNAGMNQFKDALCGFETRDYSRATSVQRCVRAGGKHNDLENVGYTARHHTFFEMLGNFSLGDYFKEETIGWAWEFITDVLQIAPERLWITVHTSDDEAEKIWRDHIGVPAERITRLDADNFWSMGDTGPCGPCTEVFYDHGAAVAGGPPGSADADGDRFVEFWNLVFPQFERHPDGTLTPLASPGVDTGMGLERTTAILQGVSSNYEIDLFAALMTAAGALAGIPADQTQRHASLKVIADHIRSSAFLITDGVIPGNEERSYVLRRIIRRGLRHGHRLGLQPGFFSQLVAPVVEQMGDAYPELTASAGRVTGVLAAEEDRFSETLSQGMEILERALGRLEGDQLAGELAFQLYDTYGFPVDLTSDVARERNISVDMAGFDQAMEQQRTRARAASRFQGDAGATINVPGRVDFIGYEADAGEATVVALFRSGEADAQPVDQLHNGEEGVVVLDRSPFYAESGGQVGDQGQFSGADGSTFAVHDTRKSGDQHLHRGRQTSGALRLGQSLATAVDHDRRSATRRNHSATHLLHAALREILGPHVAQRGSLVDPARLRFDFAHHEPLSAALLTAIEEQVNREILRNTLAETDLLSYDDAIARGAMALFGEKYGDTVRVLSMGDGYSVELCGGTHVGRTGDIGAFHITGESGVAAGVRRIEAVTGEGALALWRHQHSRLDAVAALVRSPADAVADRVQGLLDQNRQLEKEVAQLKQRLASSRSVDLADEACEVGGVQVLASDLGDVEPASLLGTLDTLKSRLSPAVIVLAAQSDGRVSLAAGVTQDATDRFSAVELVREIGAKVGARGGGRPDMARAGGGDQPGELAAALAAVVPWVKART